MWIYAWHESSMSAKALAAGLGAKRIRHEKSSFVGRPSRIVINWGASKYPQAVTLSTVINPADRVVRASNKLSFFQLMDTDDGPRVPEWSDDPTDAIKWHNSGHEVVGRKTLNGHSGAGIVFFSDVPDIDGLLNLPLYTRYKKKTEEFRVHVFRGKVIDVQKKLLRTTDDAGNPIDPDQIDFRVRNLANGFIFGRNDITVHDDVLKQAVLAFNKTSLDFGAIDVIWNESESRAYVLEINTAPGLQGTTLDNYIQAMKEL